ncbi:MAG TPA: energy transducer TonB [Nitrospirae bacterium]|nr:energy transducer TonB [Nitrospirota bacterium]
MAIKRIIKNHGMGISVLIHIFILSIPLSTTVMSLSEQGTGDIEISIIESYNAAPAISPRVRKVRVVKKERIEQVEIKEKPEVKILQKKKPETTAADKEPVKEVAAAETDIIKPAAEEEMDEAQSGVTEPEDGGQGPLQSVLSAVEDSVGTAKEDAMQSGLSSEKAYVTEFGSADGPRFLKRVFPEYPWVARKRGKEGRVLLRLTIDESGRLVDVEIVERAGFGFEREAMEAVRKSVFLPARRHGIPVKSEVLLPVRFVLERRR